MKKNYTRVAGLTRRNLLRLSVMGIFAGLSARLFPGAGPAWAATGALSQPGVLVVYYSRSGNTRAVAQAVHQRVGGDLVELLTVDPYPEDYQATTAQAKKELQSGYRPPLQTKIGRMDDYGVIFVGSPCWWGTVATPVITFLSEYDFSGKTIVPFMTHEGSGLGRTVAHIKSLCPGARVTEGLAVRGGRAHDAGARVDRWLHEIGMAR